MNYAVAVSNNGWVTVWRLFRHDASGAESVNVHGWDAECPWCDDVGHDMITWRVDAAKDLSTGKWENINAVTTLIPLNTISSEERGETTLYTWPPSYANSFIAVGNRGLIMALLEGGITKYGTPNDAWVPLPINGIPQNLNGVAAGGDPMRVVAVGDKVVVEFNIAEAGGPDAPTRRVVIVGPVCVIDVSDNLLGVTNTTPDASGTTFVAVGKHGTILTSTQKGTWTRSYSGTTKHLRQSSDAGTWFEINSHRNSKGC